MFSISYILAGYKVIKRINRYTALIVKDGIEEKAYIANSGRMTELFMQGAPIFIRKAGNPKRKTKYDLIAIQPGETIICIDSRGPNWIFENHLNEGKLEELKGYQIKKREFKIGTSRIDYLLESDKEKCLVELKLCTLVENQKMLFPDAVSERSARHLIDLMNATNQGYRVIVYFIGLRRDPRTFGPNKEVDPEFAETFQKVLNSNVEISALKTEIRHELDALVFSDLEAISIQP